MIKELIADLWLPKVWESEIFLVGHFSRFETQIQTEL